MIRIDHGDYHAGKLKENNEMIIFEGKGIGYCKIILYEKIILSLFITHTIAKYSNNDKYYSGIRIIYYSFSKKKIDRITQIWELAKFVKLITSKIEKDSFIIVAGDFNILPNSHEYNLLIEISKLKDCYWEFNRNIGQTAVFNKNQRLDYILYNENGPWTLLNCSITMKDKGK